MIAFDGVTGNGTISGTLTVGRLVVTQLSESPSQSTTSMGAPTSGTFEEGDIWIDVNYARFRCTAAGTPGSWVQVTPAIVNEEPGSPPTNYLIQLPNQNWVQFFWTGAAWVPVFLTPGIY